MRKAQKSEKPHPRMSRNGEKGEKGTFCVPAHIPESDTLLAAARPLALWYAENARSLPWREGREPYRVWLSEVMLQQTRIEAVRPYYARFLEAAPTPVALAALPEDRLMKLWQGLGYYSRARNLHRAARVIVERHGGALPADYDALRALPGVGEYTAGAIASIAFGLPTPAVDGNVLRVVARVLGDDSNVLDPDTKKRVTAALSCVYREADKDESLKSALCARRAGLSVPAALTEGLMELGQTRCLPNREPLCEGCPLASLCAVKRSRAWDKIPYREKQKARKKEARLVLLLADEAGRFAIRRRPDRGLLASLFELPSILLPTGKESDEALDTLGRAFCKEHGLVSEESASLSDARHIFTHIEWQMKGRFFNVSRTEATDDALVFASPREIGEDYALPSAFSSYLAWIGGENK